VLAIANDTTAEQEDLGRNQRATYRHVVTMSDMPLTTDIPIWVIQVARCHGKT